MPDELENWFRSEMKDYPNAGKARVTIYATVSDAHLRVVVGEAVVAYMEHQRRNVWWRRAYRFLFRCPF
jgi:fructose-specific component phosphotransferase system IIB-like protein